jgi:hypothetical protein
MSDEASAVTQTSRSVVILGADALLVALPSTPSQLANACFASGFDAVYPSTWGDELIAAGCLEQLEGRNGPAIFCACPLVAEQLRSAAELDRFIVSLISPPVAVARYLRALHSDDALTITYVGDCPGADDDSIDARLSPNELLNTLSKRGIMPAAQRPDLDSRVAHDRRRFYSLPGGVPSPHWLSAQWPKRALVDVHAGDAIARLANQSLSRGNTLIDFAPQVGCACAGAVCGNDAESARGAVVALEPPRAQSEIVRAPVDIQVSLAPAGEHLDGDVTWGDFLAALPAALALHPDDGSRRVSARPSARLTQRRAVQTKVSLPRAYLAARASARRERSSPTPREPAPSAVAVPHAPREEISAARPWIARRASEEGFTGPRGQSHRAGLTTLDRWLLSGLMLTSSVLVAVLTSALTVRGMQRTGAPAAASEQSGERVAAAASVPAHDTSASIGSVRAEDSTPVMNSVRRDSAADRAMTTVSAVPSDSASMRTSMLPRPMRTPRRITRSAEKHAVSVAEHVRAPLPLTSTNVPLVREPVVRQSPPEAGAAPTRVTAAPATAPAPAPAAAAPLGNAQFLEELRAIHAEIDARKRHMDSLTAALDSLKHVSKPE